MKKLLSLLMAALMLLSTLTACGSAGNTPEADASESTPAKDSLSMITVIKTESLDPFSGTYGDKTVPRMIFDTLFNYDENGGIVPCLAESWEDDGTDVTIKLRQDVYFTDGEQFTADDVMFAFDKYAADPAFSARIANTGICEKLDDFTVVFHKTSPYAPVLATLAENFSIVSSKAYAADPEGFAKNPVGSGPYKFVSQDVDGSVVFVANEDYFMGAPAIKNVTIKPPVEPSTAVIALQASEVDLVANIPMAQKPLIESDENLKYVEKNGWIMSMLLLCGDKFTDANLRKAIYHSLDLESIVLIGNEGVGVPAKDLCSDIIMGNYKGKVPFGEYDVEKAKEYLAESDYAAGTEFTLSITPEYASVAQVVQFNLEAIGISVKIEQLDLNSLYGKMFSGEVEMTVTYIGNATTPIEAIIDGYNTSPFDTMLHKTDALGAVIDQMKGEYDATARSELVLDAMQMIKDNADFIPLFELASTVAYSKDLKGVQDIAAASYLYYINQMSFE